MKPSGLGWAGDIPAHWDAAKICMVARLESGHTPSRQHPEYWVPEECTIPWFSLADVWQLREGKQEYLGETKEKISPRGLANSAARLLPTGTVVLSRTASVGFAGIMPRPMATTQDFANWVCGSRLQPEYLLYALRAMEDEFRRATMGSTHQTIYMPDIRKLAIPIPPVDEQNKIVRLLRAKLPLLDDLIAKKERLLTLLAEERQSLITEAVTKGLKRNVPLKDSGVPWIGATPETWTVARIRQVARLKSGHTPSRQHPEYWVPSECTIPWVSLADVWQLRDGTIDYIDTTREKISPLGLANSPAQLLPAETVILSRTASVGFSAILRVPMATTQDFVNWICGPRLRPEFLLFVFRAMVQDFERLTMGSVHRTIYMPDVARMTLAVPPVEEQDEIVDFLRAKRADSHRLTSKIEEQVSALKQYRHAVITSAVTGKLPTQQEQAA
ncbi:MAG: restriction endonuclease subunit S [Labilithrix sp.]